MTENIMTIRDVAEYLKVTEKTIYRLLARHQLPAFKVGGSWRFRRMDIDEWIMIQRTANDKDFDRFKEIKA